MFNTPADLVRAHARAHTLLALHRMITNRSVDSSMLRDLNASTVESASVHPEFRTWAAEMFLCDTAPDPNEVLRIIGSLCKISDEVQVLPATNSLRTIVGHSFEAVIASDSKSVSCAWATACDVFDKLGLNELRSVVRAVDLITGLNGPRGEIRAFSNPHFPGFVAIGINNPPLILAEQAVHEAMHVTLAARIALDAALDLLTDQRVGILSPFTGSVRTIERVAHGILSYAAVRELWRAVDNEERPELLMEVPNLGVAKGLIARRLRTLDGRLSVAMSCLLDGAGREACDLLVKLSLDLLNAELEAPVSELSRRKDDLAAAGLPDKPVGLNSVQRAELHFAVQGDKVSRITIPYSDVSTDGFALISCAAVAAASFTIRSVPDPRINQFSNVSGGVEHVLNASAEAEVHLYLHSDPAMVRRAALLDRDDEAGELLGIPKCCCEWFARQWPVARNIGGDAFALMVRLASHGGRAIVARECDASGMYRGGGLCWHFPCSPFCQETIRLVRRRREQLAVSNPVLLKELDRAIRSAITIFADGAHIDGEWVGDGAVVIEFR